MSQSMVGAIPSADESNMLPSVKTTTDRGLNVIVSATVGSFSIYSQTPPTPGEYAMDKILLLTTLFMSSMENSPLERLCFISSNELEKLKRGVRALKMWWLILLNNINNNFYGEQIFIKLRLINIVEKVLFRTIISIELLKICILQVAIGKTINIKIAKLAINQFLMIIGFFKIIF